jgi:uncharacterized iron-regulated membrane protein
MIRLIFLIHRYLGIALGLIITLWCLSGFVMMYMQYPEFDSKERLAGLESLELKSCCQLSNDFSNISMDRFRIEMFDSSPVLRLMDGPYQYIIDLLTGEYLPVFNEAEIYRSAIVTAQKLELSGNPQLLGIIGQDQWTIFPGFDLHRPLYHFEMNDSLGTQFYISSRTGEVVQLTNLKTRFWNWMGSIPHWLYPTILRQHTGVWLQTVIWLTIASIFLTVIGVYIGLRQYKTRRSGRKSPYHHWGLWHHFSGLFFGLFTLIWLISGLLSVNPWGVLEGRSYIEENQHLKGGVLNFEDVRNFIYSLPGNYIPASTVRLDGYRIDKELSLITYDSNGVRMRLNASTFGFEPLPDDFFARVMHIIRPEASVTEGEWITVGDAYYYNHHNVQNFPVYRLNYSDGEIIYLDSVSGEIVFAVDNERRWFRWLFQGLHRGDFSQLIRKRPLWDFLMWTLMLGVTVGAFSGTWLGIRRLIRSAINPKKFPFNSISNLS